MNDERIVVLGGGGGIGRVVAAALAQVSDPTAVTVADAVLDRATETVAQVRDNRFQAVSVDVTDQDALRSLVSTARCVVNCVGPFYRLSPRTLQSIIMAGVDYLDVCDDLSATRAMLELDESAKRTGVRALTGMGNSPGLANIFVKLCSEQFLDEVTGVRIMHIHGGEPDEGPAVIKHRIHAMTSDVPILIDGEFVHVRMLEASGQAFVREEDFSGVGTYSVFPYPHPETITLPKAFRTLRDAANLGVVFPMSYFDLTRDLVRAGFASEEPLSIADARVAPIDVAVALLRRERPALLAEAEIASPAGCLKVIVTGLKDGEVHTYVASVFSSDQGAGAGTGIPAAIGAVLSLRGLLEGGPGVHAPETAVPVAQFLSVAAEIVPGMGIGDGTGMPLRLEHLAPDGDRQEIPFSLGKHH